MAVLFYADTRLTRQSGRFQYNLFNFITPWTDTLMI